MTWPYKVFFFSSQKRNLKAFTFQIKKKLCTLVRVQ